MCRWKFYLRRFWTSAPQADGWKEARTKLKGLDRLPWQGRRSRSAPSHGARFPFYHIICEICSKFDACFSHSEDAAVSNLNVRTVPSNKRWCFLQVRVSPGRVTHADKLHACSTDRIRMSRIELCWMSIHKSLTCGGSWGTVEIVGVSLSQHKKLQQLLTSPG